MEERLYYKINNLIFIVRRQKNKSNLQLKVVDEWKYRLKQSQMKWRIVNNSQLMKIYIFQEEYNIEIKFKIGFYYLIENN